MDLDEHRDTGKDRCMREQEFGHEDVTDMLAPALVGQDVEIAAQDPPRYDPVPALPVFSPAPANPLGANTFRGLAF